MIHKLSAPKKLEHKLRSIPPWIFRHMVDHTLDDGELVLLVDSKNKGIVFGLADSGDISIRVLGRSPRQIRGILEQRIQQAHQLRTRFGPPKTNCFRLINGEGDGLSGLIVDVYDNTVVLRLYAKCWIPYLDIIVDILSKLPNTTRVYRKFGVRNVDGRKGGITLLGSELPDHLLVKEHGITFLVRPKKGQKTGLFLDQREHRKIIGGMSKDKLVSNLFAYNGGFSIYAAMGGAKRVYSIDIAARALDDAKEIFRLNGINPDKHVFEATDAFQWKSPESMDIFICDPPSLSKGKHSDSNAQKAYQDLAANCAKQVAKGNILATASCTARLTSKEWERSIINGVRSQGQWSWLWRSYEPMDHPTMLEHFEARYLKFALLHRRQ
jgi:23S rRNA (cytosine1962-C5)-methyltransferase